jgi:two-component system phosphate regulon sensor histidine kinase PhoR
MGSFFKLGVRGKLFVVSLFGVIPVARSEGFGWAVLGAVVAALLLSQLAAYWLTRDLVRLERYSRTLSQEGRAVSTEELPLAAGDELGSLARSIYSLGQQQQRSEEEISAQLSRFEELLELIEAGALLFDEQWMVLRANPAAERLLGVVGLAGRSLVEITRSPGIHTLTESGKSETAEVHLAAPSGRTVLANMSYPPSLPGGVLLLQDITAMRQLERVRSDFVANASHELRTPVGVIRANAENLLDGALEDPETARKFSEAILRNAERLSSLVSDLLDLSRIESGAGPVGKKALLLGPVVAAILEELRGAAKSKEIELGALVPKELKVLANQQGLAQALSNLVDNAIRHIPDGSQVEIRALEDQGRCRIEVKDSGLGIEPRHRARVFERFYRVDAGRSRAVGGTGLGLSIVRHLAESMGGEVHLESPETGGCCFVMTLDLA